MKNKARTFRRRVEGKTDYYRRLRLLHSKKSRLVVRKSLNNIRAQIVSYEKEGDKIIVSAFSPELSKLGWKYSSANTSAAYLTGLLCGSRAIGKGQKEAVLDIGLHNPINKSKIYAVLKGALDAGLTIPHGEKALPSEERIQGKHIVDFASELAKKDKKAYEKQFSSYLKNKTIPEDISKTFEAVKKKIMETKK
jgi:large subunit ribosomal protein L18